MNLYFFPLANLASAHWNDWYVSLGTGDMVGVVSIEFTKAQALKKCKVRSLCGFGSTMQIDKFSRIDRVDSNVKENRYIVKWKCEKTPGESGARTREPPTLYVKRSITEPPSHVFKSLLKGKTFARTAPLCALSSRPLEVQIQDHEFKYRSCKSLFYTSILQSLLNPVIST